MLITSYNNVNRLNSTYEVEESQSLMAIPFLDSFFLSCPFCLLLSFAAPLVLFLFQVLPVWWLLLLALSDLSRPGKDTDKRYSRGSGWVKDATLGSDNELLVTGMQEKRRFTDFVSEIKRAKNKPDFENWHMKLNMVPEVFAKITEEVSMEPTYITT